jgi:site-specific recombinase
MNKAEVRHEPFWNEDLGPVVGPIVWGVALCLGITFLGIVALPVTITKVLFDVRN